MGSRKSGESLIGTLGRPIPNLKLMNRIGKGTRAAPRKRCLECSDCGESIIWPQKVPKYALVSPDHRIGKPRPSPGFPRAALGGERFGNTWTSCSRTPTGCGAMAFQARVRHDPDLRLGAVHDLSNRRAHSLHVLRRTPDRARGRMRSTASSAPLMQLRRLLQVGGAGVRHRAGRICLLHGPVGSSKSDDRAACSRRVWESYSKIDAGPALHLTLGVCPQAALRRMMRSETYLPCPMHERAAAAHSARSAPGKVARRD